MTLFAGIDVGGTNVKLGIADHHGRILGRASIPTRPESGPEDCVRRIGDALRRIQSGKRLAACGAGVPGPLDRARRTISIAPNLPQWTKVPLTSLLSKQLGLPAFIENDANCAALGEYAASRDRPKCMVLYTLGTGVGGGIVLHGELWTGPNGVAGELGHVVVEPNGRRCGCGQLGCLEAYASATAVARQYHKLTRQRQLTTREIFGRAASGDQAARAAINEAVRMLGTGIATVVHILNPDRIVLSGGMAAGRGLLSQVRLEIARRILPVFAHGLRIERGVLGENAGWIGAAMVARDRS